MSESLDLEEVFRPEPKRVRRMAMFAAGSRDSRYGEGADPDGYNRELAESSYTAPATVAPHRHKQASDMHNSDTMTPSVPPDAEKVRSVPISVASGTVAVGTAMVCIFSLVIWYISGFVLINPAVSIICLVAAVFTSAVSVYDASLIKRELHDGR